MKKETSLRKVIETLSAHDTRAEDARLLTIHKLDLDDGTNYIFRIRHADGFIRAVKFPLYEEPEEPVLTKEEAIKRHRMMWNWIAFETLKREKPVSKSDAISHFGWDPFDEMRSKCWCCTYIYKNNIGCENCPIQWPGKRCTSTVCEDGLYDAWCDATYHPAQYKKAADLAYQIANLPEREDVE